MVTAYSRPQVITSLHIIYTRAQHYRLLLPGHAAIYGDMWLSAKIDPDTPLDAESRRRGFGWLRASGFYGLGFAAVFHYQHSDEANPRRNKS